MKRMSTRFFSSFFFDNVCLQKFFENRRHWFTPKGIYTRIVVVVNARHFLWISPFSVKESVTWAFYKLVNDSVHGRCLFWTIFGAVYKPGVVHKRYLWICRSLSTGCSFYVAAGLPTWSGEAFFMLAAGMYFLLATCRPAFSSNPWPDGFLPKQPEQVYSQKDIYKNSSSS
jgi:hypothetical protein